MIPSQGCHWPVWGNQTACPTQVGKQKYGAFSSLLSWKHVTQCTQQTNKGNTLIISYARAYLVSFSNPLASGRLREYQITKVRRGPCLSVPSGATHVSRHHCLTFECVRCAKKGMDFFPVSFLFGIVGINFLAVRIYTSALYITQILYYLTQFLTLGNFSLFKSKHLKGHSGLSVCTLSGPQMGQFPQNRNYG